MCLTTRAQSKFRGPVGRLYKQAYHLFIKKGRLEYRREVVVGDLRMMDTLILIRRTELCVA